MTKKNTITINGRLYDVATGLPVSHVEKAPAQTTQVSQSQPAKIESDSTKITVNRQPVKHHAKQPQRSSTLRRDVVARPKGAHEASPHRAQPVRARVATSPHIQKFAPHPVTPLAAAKTSVPRNHSTQVTPSHAEKVAHARMQSKKPVHATAQSSRELKEHLIKQSLAQATPQSRAAKHTAKKQSLFAKPLKASSVMAGSLAVVMMGGYLTYINMPGISTRVAASQAGIEASYPGYKPDGYRFKGPVAYEQGQVNLSFASNSGPQAYNISQKNSNWDSETVLDSFVTQQSENYSTHTSQGVTVYTYDSGAAWVNKGVFYTLEGDATLSTEQVLRIANSM